VVSGSVEYALMAVFSPIIFILLKFRLHDKQSFVNAFIKILSSG
jgi:hypothetical protein